MKSNWNNATILIVEDVESSIMFYKSAFKHSGARILLALDGEQAIEIVNNTPNIDVILMDIHMPNMNGLEATTKIKSMHPNIAIIIQTAYVLQHTEYECFEAGCDAFLEKPISLAKLLNLVDELINKK